ncbi:hypothetical protein JCM10908_000942 [Rhodotorula pacifica]|uniref:uncharacterized protein n=1 Tax=Rhodotorula pacifica TaxID=1495444 RepID=UPI003172E48B
MTSRLYDRPRKGTRDAAVSDVRSQPVPSQSRSPAISSERPTALPKLRTAAPPSCRSASTVARIRTTENPLTRPEPAGIKGKERAHGSEVEAGPSAWRLQTHQARVGERDTQSWEQALSLETRPLAAEAPTNSSNGLEGSPFPSDRTQLLLFVNALPEKPTRQDFLTLRSHAKRLDALDDVDFLSSFVLRANRAGYEDVGVRYFRQALKLLVAKSDFLPTVAASVAEPLLADLIARKRWMAALDISNALVANGIQSPGLLVQRMQILCGRGRYADAIEAFDSYSDERDPPPQAFDIAINAHLCQADLGAAQALLAEKAKRGMPTTVETYLLLLNGMDVFGGNLPMEEKMLSAGSEAELLAGEAPRQDVRILNRLMSVRAARGALRDALAVLDFFDLDAYPREIVDAYRSLPAPVLEEAIVHDAHRPRPDAATLVILVGIALRQQQPDLAERLVVSGLTAGGVVFNDHLAAAIMRIHLTQHDVSAAETFAIKLSTGSAQFGGVDLPAHEPSSKVFEPLLAGMLRYRGLAGANAAFASLQKRFDTEVAVSEGMTLALVEHLSRGPISAVGLSSAMLMQVQELTQGKVRPEAKLLDALLKAAWQRDRLQSRSFGTSPQALEQDFPVEEADIITEARSSERNALRQPPAPTAAYTPPEAELLVRSSDSSSTSSSIARMRESLADRDVRHTRDTSRHIIRNDHLLRFIDAKWDYLQTQVVDLGIRPNYHHVTVLMRAYLRLGDARGANNVLRYATTDLGLAPHVAYYSTLISGLSRLGKYTAVARVYSDFLASGLEPDRNFFAALAMSYARRRDVAAVERVFSDMRAFIRAHAPAPQIQARALRTAASSNSSTGIPPAISMPYDPVLDAVFVNILYRAQVSTGQYLAAQEQVLHSLQRGMVPDPVLLKSLQRTRKWIKHKENQLAESSSSVVHTSGNAQVDLRGDELAELKRRNAVNISRVRKMLQRMSPPVEKKELRDLERYWEQVEKGAFEPDSHEEGWRQQQQQREEEEEDIASQ